MLKNVVPHSTPSTALQMQQSESQDDCERVEAESALQTPATPATERLEFFLSGTPTSASLAKQHISQYTQNTIQVARTQDIAARTPSTQMTVQQPTPITVMQLQQVSAAGNVPHSIQCKLAPHIKLEPCTPATNLNALFGLPQTQSQLEMWEPCTPFDSPPLTEPQTPIHSQTQTHKLTLVGNGSDVGEREARSPSSTGRDNGVTQRVTKPGAQLQLQTQSQLQSQPSQSPDTQQDTQPQQHSYSQSLYSHTATQPEGQQQAQLHAQTGTRPEGHTHAISSDNDPITDYSHLSMKLAMAHIWPLLKYLGWRVVNGR